MMGFLSMFFRALVELLACVILLTFLIYWASSYNDDLYANQVVFEKIIDEILLSLLFSIGAVVVSGYVLFIIILNFMLYQMSLVATILSRLVISIVSLILLVYITSSGSVNFYDAILLLGSILISMAASGFSYCLCSKFDKSMTHKL